MPDPEMVDEIVIPDALGDHHIVPTLGDPEGVAVQGDAAGTVSQKLRGINKTLKAFYDALILLISGGRWKVDGSGVTQPVSGTVAVSGSVEVVNDVGNPLPVSGTVAVSNLPATQPISAAALPLPAGAATSAKQDTGNTSAAAMLTGIGAPEDLSVFGDVNGNLNEKLRGIASIVNDVQLGDKKFTVTIADSAAADPQPHLGQVGGHSASILSDWLNPTEPSYSEGRCIGGKFTLPVNRAVSTGLGIGALLTSLVVTDRSGTAPPLTVFFFTSQPEDGTYADGGNLAIDTSDSLKMLGFVSVVSGDYLVFGDCAYANLRNLNLQLMPDTGSALDVWFAVRADDEIDLFNPQRLRVRFNLVQD